MDLHVRLGGRGDLAEQIFRQVLEAILDGRLRPGERLPPSRALAARLSVSRNTVGVAYERLAAEGVIEGRVGAGSFVIPGPLPARPAGRAPSGVVAPRAAFKALPVVRQPPPVDVRFDFGIGTPDHALFPLTVWRRFVAAALRGSAEDYSTYRHPAGHPALRAAVARHAGVSRAVRASADDVVLTDGAQQAFDLVGRVLISPGLRVAVEDPGYTRPRLLFESLGARIAGVPVDDEGLRVDRLPPSARLVYVTPSHQFPTGVIMSLRRRMALLDWADRAGAVIVEDDYDTEFRFGGRPLDPLQSLDRSGRVVYVGSFSKVLLPGLRQGFLVAPASLQPALQAARQLTDWHGDVTTQAALARFIDSGRLARHIRVVTRVYADRYARIAAGIDRHLARWLAVVPSSAGMHVAALVHRGVAVQAADVVDAAARRGLRLHALADFAVRPPAMNGIVLGFGAIPAARIDAGLALLARVFAASDRAAARG
ncbi:MAG: PLP-dependent aminotransferase family protein [Vicinamibacterales bacterium]